MWILFFKRLKKLSVILTTPLLFRGLRFGVAAATEHGRLLSTLDIDHCVDIGANKGQFSLIFRHCQPQARITAYEPIASPYAKLVKTMASDTNFTAYNEAIGNFSGKVDINVSASDDSSSLLEISELQEKTFPGTYKKTSQSISVTPISSYNELFSPSDKTFLKIDVQGYELEVLKSCQPVFPLIKWVYVELSFKELYRGQPLCHEVIEFLSDHDFFLMGVYNNTIIRGECIQCDFIFENSNWAKKVEKNKL